MPTSVPYNYGDIPDVSKANSISSQVLINSSQKLNSQNSNAGMILNAGKTSNISAIGSNNLQKNIQTKTVPTQSKVENLEVIDLSSESNLDVHPKQQIAEHGNNTLQQSGNVTLPKWITSSVSNPNQSSIPKPQIMPVISFNPNSYLNVPVPNNNYVLPKMGDSLVSSTKLRDTKKMETSIQPSFDQTKQNSITDSRKMTNESENRITTKTIQNNLNMSSSFTNKLYIPLQNTAPIKNDNLHRTISKLQADPKGSSTLLQQPQPGIIEKTVFTNLNKNATPEFKPNNALNPIPSVTNPKKRKICPLADLINPEPIPDQPPLKPLNAYEKSELERLLQFKNLDKTSFDDYWRDDWGGNLQLVDKEITMNREQILRIPTLKAEKMPFRDWVCSRAKDSSSAAFRGIRLLFSFVYHLEDTPETAKKILSHSLHRYAKDAAERSEHISSCIRRISYDPGVLQEDGWTIEKAESPVGASGGSYLIGTHVIWSGFEAVVIAFVKDEEIGDLWKAMWVEDLETFDLEADELQDATKKYQTKIARKKSKVDKSKTSSNVTHGSAVNKSGLGSKSVQPSTSTRFSATSNFTVDGIEHGIILATSYNENARMGVLWPARVVHVSELNGLGKNAVTSRRSSQKNNIAVVFLAPYWNGSLPNKKSTNFDETKNVYSNGPLFELDNVEVSSNTIQKYPYFDDFEKLSIDKLRDSFRFLGLPKLAFSRFIDSHRIAQALRTYSKNHITGTNNDINAFAALTDTHILAVKTAMFPRVVLDLPYEYIISKMPIPGQRASHLGIEDIEEETEPVLRLNFITKAMTPPYCWMEELNRENLIKTNLPNSPETSKQFSPVTSPEARTSMSVSCNLSNITDKSDVVKWTPANFASNYLLDFIGNGEDLSSSTNIVNTSIGFLGQQLSLLVQRLCNDVSIASKKSKSVRKEMLNSLSSYCLLVKGHGEDTLYSLKSSGNNNIQKIVLEWRKACEKIYKCACIKLSLESMGNGVTTVITDSRCNQHLTSSGSFERAVRLPAAIKAAKNAGAGKNKNMPLIYQVTDKYIKITENKILPRAHKSSYLKRMKMKILALPQDAKGIPLTDDSDGEGGDDTMGSRGSFSAAVVGVAAALQAVDTVMKGESVNAFCAVRPPGHHAGKELRPMNATSNGFCLLNGAACAALYATLPQAEGGCGAKRVCVIDFDVHHGNGTQDILCSTYDSRFLYVSIHAGGAHINGYESGGYGNSFRRNLGTDSKQPEGIFPGKCGDTSPHPGVLNIPLGQKVTAHAVGNALVTKVSPAVRAFSPELIILSAGFDAHKNDPLGMGGLDATDFGSITEIACQMAAKCCSGRVISILEGGYGVPCCRPLKDLFLPSADPQPRKYFDLGSDLPTTMDDNVDESMQQALDKCHSEGFLQCVEEHVGALSRNNKRNCAQS